MHSVFSRARPCQINDRISPALCDPLDCNGSFPIVGHQPYYFHGFDASSYGVETISQVGIISVVRAGRQHHAAIGDRRCPFQDRRGVYPGLRDHRAAFPDSPADGISGRYRVTIAEDQARNH